MVAKLCAISLLCERLPGCRRGLACNGRTLTFTVLSQLKTTLHFHTVMGSTITQIEATTQAINQSIQIM